MLGLSVHSVQGWTVISTVDVVVIAVDAEKAAVEMIESCMSDELDFTADVVIADGADDVSSMLPGDRDELDGLVVVRWCLEDLVVVEDSFLKIVIK